MMIPKTMSFYWDDTTPLSFMRYMTLESFRKFHPDWRMDLYVAPASDVKQWTTWEKQDFHSYEGKDYSHKLRALGVNTIKWEHKHSLHANPQHISDLLSWWVLSTSGGFYSDMDILWVRNIDSWVDALKDYDTFVCMHDWISIGFMGSQGNNDFFRDLFHLSLKIFRGDYESIGKTAVQRLLAKDERDLPAHKKVRIMYPQFKFFNIPMKFCYNWTYRQLNDLYSRRPLTVPVDTYGIHWYGGNEKSQFWNKEIYEGSLKQAASIIPFFALMERIHNE